MLIPKNNMVYIEFLHKTIISFSKKFFFSLVVNLCWIYIYWYLLVKTFPFLHHFLLNKKKKNYDAQYKKQKMIYSKMNVFRSFFSLYLCFDSSTWNIINSWMICTLTSYWIKWIGTVCFTTFRFSSKWINLIFTLKRIEKNIFKKEKNNFYSSEFRHFP